MHIAIAGNIGSGKTTLTRLLTKNFNWEPKYEVVDTNPYLSDFYTDMQRWSFNLQIFFLNKRFMDVVDIEKAVRTSSRTEPYTRMPEYLHPTFTRWGLCLPAILRTTPLCLT